MVSNPKTAIRNAISVGIRMPADALARYSDNLLNFKLMEINKKYLTLLFDEIAFSKNELYQCKEREARGMDEDNSIWHWEQRVRVAVKSLDAYLETFK